MENLKFIFSLKNSLGFKCLYLLEKVLGKVFSPDIRFFNDDYILRGKDATFLIKAHSDMDYIARPNFERILLPYFKCTGVFVDVGAHMGKWTVTLAKTAKEVYSFEPNPETYQYLLSNLLLNNLVNVHTFPVAVSDKEGMLPFQPNPKDTGTSRVIENGSTQVKAVTLDETLRDVPAIELLKIDTEWFGYNVLLGATETIKKTERIICEVTPDDKNRDAILALLAAAGFARTPLPTGIDYLFTR